MALPTEGSQNRAKKHERDTQMSFWACWPGVDGKAQVPSLCLFAWVQATHAGEALGYHSLLHPTPLSGRAGGGMSSMRLARWLTES